jgi:hypothetical protein
MIPARPKYQVFISSTYADLREAREAVTWAILTARHIPVGMEAFTATDDRGWQTIKSAIDRSDYYVLLLAGRYGSTDKDGLSWTEKEYEYAVSRKIPTLVFIRSKASITADQLDDDPPARKRLEAFKRRARETHLYAEWANKEELVARVSDALRNHIIDDEDSGRPRPGWYRGDELPKTATLDEFARLSSETERLKSELESVRAAMEEAPSLSLVDRNQYPVTGQHKIIRTLKLYHPLHASLQEMKSKGSGRDSLVLNALAIFELGVVNVGRSLVEHVVLDVTLGPISGFRCGTWNGKDLKNVGTRLLSNTILPQYRSEYPESVRLDEFNQITLRFRLERIAVGNTEYIPPLFVVGAVENEGAFFSLRHKIAGSVGSATSGQCEYEIEFNGISDVGEAGKRKDQALLKEKYGGEIILNYILFES